MKIQLQKVIKIMKEKGMDLAVLTNPANIRYVSDFDVPFWPAWMGDVSNGLPMVIAIIDVNQEKVHVVASDLYKNKLVRAGLINTALWRSFTHLEKNDVENNRCV